jgi:hypothetical protein
MAVRLSVLLIGRTLLPRNIFIPVSGSVAGRIRQIDKIHVKFEVFTMVTMKNVVLQDVTQEHQSATSQKTAFLIKSVHDIGSQTRDLPACRIVP